MWQGLFWPTGKKGTQVDKMLKYTNGQAFNELERIFNAPQKLTIVGAHDATISVMAATFLSRGANFIP